MNKFISLLLTLSFLVATFFYGAAAQTCTDNLFANPGFDSGLTGWNNLGGGSIVSDANSGASALKVTGGTDNRVIQAISVTPGQTYEFGFWGKRQGNQGFVRIKWLTSNWQPINSTIMYVSTNSWLSYNGLITAPSNAAYLEIGTEVSNAPSADIAYFDDFCLTEMVSGGPCSITVNSAGISCDDNGTPTNPSDDLFYVNLLVNGSFTGNSGWTTVVNGLTVSGSYGVPGQVGPFPVSNGMVSFFVQDIDEPACNGQVSVPAPSPCSSTGPADLAVTSVACPANYPDWTQPFTWNVNVKNNGSSASQASPIYVYNYAPQAVGYASQLLGSATVPALSPGQTAPVAITSQPSAHSAIPGDASYGEDFLLTGAKGLSFTQIGFGNPPAYTEADGFPNIYCKKYSTDIAVDVSSTMTTVAPTEPVVYTVKVTNNGPVDAYNISSSLFASNSGTPFPGGITAQLSTGLIWYVYTPGGGGTLNTGQVWDIPFLAAGQSATATVTQDPGGNSPWPSSGFTISKTADSGHNMDTNPANNSSQVSFNSGGGGGQVDLSLNITSASQLAPFSNISFQVVAQNSGPGTVTDVDIQVTKPNNVVYVGGNEYSVTAGTFLPSDLGTWGISSLAAGESAVLTVNFFTLTSNNVTLYARTSGAVGDDVDSTPGNGSCCIPTEDDETTYTLVGGGPTGQPDLTILDLQIPTPSVAAGAILSYNFDASNAGTVAVPGNFTIKSYISTDQVLSADDIQDGLISTGNYAAGFSENNIPGASTIPANLAAGHYYLILKVDADDGISESNEGNNVTSAAFEVDGGNDCYCISFINCQDNGTPNDPTDDLFTFVVNIGTSDPNPPVTQYSISINGQSSYGTFGIPQSVGPFPISNGPLDVAISGYLTSENVTVTPPPPCSNGSALPDLFLSSFEALRSGSAPPMLMLLTNNAEVKTGDNIGFVSHFTVLDFPAPSPTVTVSIKGYLSTDNNLDAGDLLLASDTRTLDSSVQAAGITEGGFGSGQVPFSTTPGNYFLLVKYDADDALVETNEANNFLTLPIVITPGSPSGGDIDLELSLAQPNQGPVQWSSYSVTATLTNNGNAAATGVSVKFVKPNGVVYTGGNEFDASQGSFNPNGDEVWMVGSLAPGQSATLTVNYFLLQNGAPAAYAQVSAANEQDVDSTPNNGTPPTINEDDEASTGGSGPPNLTPDLTISDLQVPNANVQPGQVLNYNFDLSNIGTGAVPGSFSVKSYLSLDNVLSANDIQDGTITTGNYGAGFSVQNVPGASTIPANLAAGQYFLIVKMDADNAIAESNENNNMVVKPFTLLNSPTTCQGNLLQNPGFEDGDQVWEFTGGAKTQSNNFANLCKTGQLLGALQGRNLSIGQTVSASAGKTYTLSCQAGIWEYTAQLGGELGLRFKNSNDQILETVSTLVNGYSPQNNILWNDFPVVIGNGGCEYTDVSFSGTAPTGTAKVEVFVKTHSFSNSTGAAGLYVDEFCLTESGSSTPDCNAINISNVPGQITIAGASAPHVLIKVFKPNWTLAYECLDNCADPLVVDGLSAGNHHVQVKLIDNGWGEICFLEQTVSVSNFSGGGGNALRFENNRQRLAFDKIYPNPAQYFVMLEVYSKDDQSAVFDFYNAQGQAVHRLEVNLAAGRNEVQVPVFDWKSGAYNVIARVNGQPAYGRFLKVWEE